MSLDECVWLLIAKEQRETEFERKEGFFGTMGYEEMGCYDCDGYNTYCPYYTPLYQIIERPEKPHNKVVDYVRT